MMIASAEARLLTNTRDHCCMQMYIAHIKNTLSLVPSANHSFVCSFIRAFIRAFIHTVPIVGSYKNNLDNVSRAIKKSICWCAKIPHLILGLCFSIHIFFRASIRLRQINTRKLAQRIDNGHKRTNTQTMGKKNRDLMCKARPIVKIKLYMLHL